MNGYIETFTQPAITEAFANKLRAEKESLKPLDGTPAEISEAFRQAMKKDFAKLMNASAATLRATIEQELAQLRSEKCA